MHELHNWSIVGITPYAAPEQGSCLAGQIFLHPQFTDGDKIQTSRITAADGRTITTESGSIYQLVGDPDPGYVQYCDETNKPLDLENPIQFK